MLYRVRVYLLPDFRGLEGVGVGVGLARGKRIKPVARTDAKGYAWLPIERIRLPRPFELVLFDDRGAAVITRTVDPRRLRRREISVPVQFQQAVLHGFVMKKGRPSQSESIKARCEAWQKAATRDPAGSGEILCLARAMASVGAGVHKPGNRVQEMVSKIAGKQLSGTEMEAAGEWFAKARAVIDDCLPGDMPSHCKGEDTDWTTMAQRIFLEPGGSGTHVSKALKAVTPDPTTLVGEPKAGMGIGRIADLEKDCVGKYEDGELSDDLSKEMEQILSGQILELRPPSVNLIDVWAPDPWSAADAVTGTSVRLGEVWERQITFSERLLLDDATVTKTTDVELDDPDCFILEADESGMQRFFVDVKPGQVVSLKGSGFVSSKARASIRFRRFTEADDVGRMQFLDAWEATPGFDQIELDVHGSELEPLPSEGPQTFNLDQIIFEWPAAAATPGLYRIDLEFDNDSDHYIEISQDPDTCELTLVKQGQVRADSIYMVVPPDLDRQAVRLRATTVDCVDETDPESILLLNLADDTSYEVTGTRFAMRLQDPTASDPLDMFELEPLGETVLASGSRRFWDAPDTWQANLQAFPESPTPFEILGLDEMVSTTMTLLEVDSDLDQAILRAVLVVALVTLIVVTFVVVAAAIVLLIVTGVIAVESFGAGAALTILVAALAAFLTGALFTAILAVIDALVAAVPNIEPIAVGGTGFQGLELAHRLAPLRLQRVLWPEERPAVTDPSLNASRISSNFTGDAFVEVFRTDNLGGRYDLTVAARAE